MRRISLALALSSSLLLAACGDEKGDDSGGSADAGNACGSDGSDGTDGSDGSDGTDGTDGTDGETGPEAVCTEAGEVPCVDQLIIDMSLHDDKVSDGAIETTTDGDDFVTVIDATAGGYSDAPNNPWVYLRFTPTGAEKIEIDDETALESMDWHMSLRRFILRLNGGSSGPSCVGAATLMEADYATLDAAPEGISYQVDDYYTADCTIKNDSSGLPGSPTVALGSWWSYDGCVKTTGYPQLIQLDDGHIIKMRVETYYGTGQEDCNDGSGSGSDSGIITLRWQYLL